MSAFEKIFRCILLVIDWVLILLAFTLAYLVRFGTFERTDFFFSEYMQVAVVVSVIWVVILLGMRVYAMGRTFLSLFHLERLFLANLAGIAMFILVFFFWKYTFYSRYLIVFLWAFSTLLLIGSHLVAHFVRQQMARRGMGISRALIIGSNREVERLVKKLNRKSATVKPVAILDAYGATVDEIDGVKILGKLNKLEQVVKEYNIDMIIQADNVEHTLNLIDFAERAKIDYRMAPGVLGMFHQTTESRIDDESFLRSEGGRSLGEFIFGK